MKKTLLLVLAVFCLFTFTNAQSENNVKLTVKLKGLKATKCSFRLQNKENPKGKWVSFPVKGETISHQWKVDEPTLVYFSSDDRAVMKFSGPDKRGYFMSPVSSFIFIAFPGMNMNVEGKVSDYVEAYPSGDKENNLVAELNRQIYPLQNKTMNVLYQMGDKTISASKKEELKVQRNKLDAQVSEISFKFVQKHISSIYGMITARKFIGNKISLKEFPKYLKKVNSKYKKSRYYKDLVDTYKRLVTQKKSQEKTKVGRKAPRIKTNSTYSGKEFDLKSYRGKYVLIDFWGTWCGYCIKGMPEMKKFADAHKAKMRIVGIASESKNLKPWRNFIKNNPYKWVQVLNGKGKYDYVKQFGVSGFPTKILISPDGKILLRHVGEDPKFYKDLEKLLK